MIIAKFGGTSVSSYKRVLTLSNIVKNELSRQPIVVVSALSGVTDRLLLRKNFKKIKTLHKNLINALFDNRKKQAEILAYVDSQLKAASEIIGKTRESLDKLASYGEIMSSYIITQALIAKGIEAVQVLATGLIVTDSHFGSAEFLVEPTISKIKKVILPLVNSGKVPVVTGFIGATKKGQVTTLGRGGSDYTASILGFAIEAEEIQIWTDVDGIFTADPRFIKNARCLPAVSFREASELAAFGARVLHPRTVRPAVKKGIPVKVLNTFNPDCCGTVITEKSTQKGQIKAVSYKSKIVLVNLYSTEMLLQKGFLARVFKVFANCSMSVDLVSVSEVSVSVSLDNKDNLEKAAKELSEFATVSIIENVGMVSMIGEEITSNTKTINRIFHILDKEKILARMISLSAANINISIVVDSEKVQRAVKVLHDDLFLKRKHHRLLFNDKISV